MHVEHAGAVAYLEYIHYIFTSTYTIYYVFLTYMLVYPFFKDLLIFMCVSALTVVSQRVSAGKWSKVVSNSSKFS